MWTSFLMMENLQATAKFLFHGWGSSETTIKSLLFCWGSQVRLALALCTERKSFWNCVSLRIKPNTRTKLSNTTTTATEKQHEEAALF